MSHMDRIEGTRPRFYVSQSGEVSNAPDITELERYWNDPTYRARVDRETLHARALAREHWDASQIAAGNRWPRHWTDEEKADATAKLMASYAELWEGYEGWYDEQNEGIAQ